MITYTMKMETFQKMHRNDHANDGVPAVQSITSVVVDLPPSCMDFSPVNSEYFIVGTYSLNSNEPKGSEPQERSGSLILYRREGEKLYVNGPNSGIPAFSTTTALANVKNIIEQEIT